jgi:hypothetical protein
MGRRKGECGSGQGPSPKPTNLYRAVIVAVLLMVVGPTTGYAEADPMEQALTAVRECITRSRVPWPEAWQQEYVDTIRAVITPHQDTPQYTRCLQILHEGFGPYWEGLRNSADRSRFEVHRAQARWYVEHLMSTELPGEEERQALRYQYEDLTGHAAQSLLTQFPFLDPDMVEKAKADHLAECYRNIDAPLLPIFLVPFSEAQVDQIKQRWHDLRYARVDLWRRLDTASRPLNEDRGVPSSQTDPHYLLMQRSFGQLRSYIWTAIGPAPDYYRRAVDNEINTQKRRLELRAEALNRERGMPRAVLQTEYLSFLLAALLETMEIPEGSADE